MQPHQNRTVARGLNAAINHLSGLRAAVALLWMASISCVVVASVQTAGAEGVVGTGNAASCTDAAFDTALAGGGLVAFNCGPDPVTIDISIGTGIKIISTDTTLNGNNLITISGGNAVGMFLVTIGVHFTVENLTIADGLSHNLSSLGSGIDNEGGTLTVHNCTFTGNDSAVGLGGGSATITGSTFTGNYSGIQKGGGTLTVTNSTFSGNGGRCGVSGECHGAAIVTVNGTLTVTNCTFAENLGPAIVHRAPVLLRNTIIAGSCDGPIAEIVDAGHNLDDGTSCGFSAANGSFSNTDPQLDPMGLQNNGGPTETVALCTGVDEPAGCTAASPAIDAGDQVACDEEPVNGLDQRGFVRPGVGHARCSIGAYEADATLPGACTGDCDGNGIVTVDEIITLVNIALGDAEPSACPHGVPNGAEVDVVLIIQAVNAALSGCPSSDLYVTVSGALSGDGSMSNPYRRITDAVARARAQRQSGVIPPHEEITIHVAPGTYVGSFSVTQLQNHPEYEVLPIILNVPSIAVRGVTVLVRDDRGLPTASESGSETLLEPDRPLLDTQSLFLVTRTADGAVGDSVTVDGFVLDGRMTALRNAWGVFVDRVSDFRISNNLIQHTGFGVGTRLASGAIEGNLLTDHVEGGIAISGGSRAQPATVLIRTNRVTGNGLHGVMALAAASFAAVLPGRNMVNLQPVQTIFDRNDPADVPNIPDTLVVTVSDNDISNNGYLGIRLFAHIPDSYQTNDDTQPLTAVLTAHVVGNTCSGNGAYGVGMEAGFPLRSNPRRFVLTFAGDFEGNTFAGNERTTALFAFTRWNVAPGISTPAEPVPPSPQDYKFAEESTYQVTDPDGELAGFDYDNPVTDAISGTALDNTLTVNGVEVPHGTSITP